MNTTETLQKQINALDERLAHIEQQAQNTQETAIVEIWTAKEAAAYGRVSYGYLMQKLIHRTDFPKNIGNPCRNGKKRFLAREVIAFFENKRG